MSTEQTKADIESGMAAFRAVRDQLDKAMESAFSRGACPGSFMLGFLSGFYSYIISNSGLAAAKNLNAGVAQTLDGLEGRVKK